MRVAIFGTCYVGLVTGTCLAEVGHDVVCVDIDQAKVDGLERGIIPIYEPGLDSMITANVAVKRLSFTIRAEVAVRHGASSSLPLVRLPGKMEVLISPMFLPWLTPLADTWIMTQSS